MLEESSYRSQGSWCVLLWKARWGQIHFSSGHIEDLPGPDADGHRGKEDWWWQDSEGHSPAGSLSWGLRALSKGQSCSEAEEAGWQEFETRGGQASVRVAAVIARGFWASRYAQTTVDWINSMSLMYVYFISKCIWLWDAIIFKSIAEFMVNTYIFSKATKSISSDICEDQYNFLMLKEAFRSREGWVPWWRWTGQANFTDPVKKSLAATGAGGIKTRSKKIFRGSGWCLAGLGKPEDLVNCLPWGSWRGEAVCVYVCVCLCVWDCLKVEKWTG